MTTELATVPDTYSPNMDEHGNYVDRVPSFNTAALVNGLRCSCGTRKDKIYTSAAMFTKHIKSQKHREWLGELNTNKVNYLSQNKQLRDLAQSQKIMIGQQDRIIDEKDRTIDEKDRTITEMRVGMTRMEVEMTRMKMKMTKMKRKNTKKMNRMKTDLETKDRIIEDNLLRKQQLMC